MTSPQLDGGVDEADRDQTEEQLAAAIVVLLAARTAGAPWLELVNGSLTGMLTHYLQRSALSMAVGAGQSGPAASTAASTGVDGVLGDVTRHTAAWLKQSATDRAPGRGGPMSRDDAEQAAGMIARTLATYARERVREHVAEQLGARSKTWSARDDSHTRPAHRELSGQTRPLGTPFTVNGVNIQRPGDPEAPLDLTAGCRCHLRYGTGPA